MPTPTTYAAATGYRRPPELEKLLLNERDAAEVLSLTPRTLQEWRRRGIGPPHIRISSRCIRYRISDLEAFAAERLRTSTSDTGEEAA